MFILFIVLELTFAPQNTRHVVQKVVMPFQSAPKSFQWVYFASYWRSKHLQCHNLRLRLYSYTFLIFSPSISIHLHRMPPGLESKESEVPKARRASRRPDGRDETKAMNLQRFCDAQRETWPNMGSRVVQTLRIKMLICHDPSVSILFPLLSFAKIANQFDVWTSTVFYVQIQRGLTEIIQNLSMPLSLSLSIMNEWFHPCVLFVFCQLPERCVRVETYNILCRVDTPTTQWFHGPRWGHLWQSTARNLPRSKVELLDTWQPSVVYVVAGCLLGFVFFLIVGRSGWGDPVFHGLVALMGS